MMITINFVKTTYYRFMKHLIQKYILYVAWIQAFLATTSSLYFSEIAMFPPCVLCWYQRIMMYPLVIILAIGIVKKDTSVPIYVLPLSIIGLLIAFYHNLLYYGLLPKTAAPCIQGVSCTTKYVAYLGFITIPFLSFLAFVVITLACVLYWRLNRKESKK
jgi:disulfide bond formation protein DsbB